MKKIYLLSLLSIFSLNLFCQINWTRYPDNPVMLPGTTGEWDEGEITVTSILYQDSTYHMWYSNGGFEPGNTFIGYATSSDGIEWTKYAGNPVLSPGSAGSWDENYVFTPSVLIHDSVYHMWYTGQSGTVFNQNYKIGHATSPDGINWTKDTLNNPVLDKGSDGDWDDIWVIVGQVTFKDTTFHIWYGGWDGTDDNLITGHATSQDGVSWTKDSLNPVLTAGSWDSPRCFPGSVFFDGSTFHMWYGGGALAAWRIGYATSEDGSHWTKQTDSPVLNVGPTGDWDDKFVTPGSVLFDSTSQIYRMWYSGNNGEEKECIGYAESQIPAWKQMNSLDPGGLTCIVDSLIYSFAGGWEGSIIGDAVNSYNTTTNEWSELTPMPIPMTEGGIGLIGDKIYLVGGWKDDWVPTDSILEYDIATDTFTFKKKGPLKIGSSASCVMNNKIYLFGGLGDPYPDVNYAYDALTYDPVNELWDTTSIPDMQYPHLMHGTAEVLDGNIYVLGGAGLPPDYTPQQSEKFDGEKWEPIAEMPVPVTLHKSIVHNNKILVFGGDSVWTIDKSYSTNLIQEYDPATDSWRLMEPMPFQRTAMSGGKVGNYVYLMGGSIDQRDPSSFVPEVWRLDLRSLKPFTIATGVSLDTNSLGLGVGDTGVLVATVSPADASDQSVIWTSGNSNVATVIDGTVAGVAGGETYVYVNTADGNFTDSCLVSVTSNVGINNTEATGFKLYPNPTSDLITLEFNSQGTHIVEITSLNGQLLYNSRMEGPTHQIDLSSFEKSLYFITVRSRDYVRTEKIIKL